MHPHQLQSCSFCVVVFDYAHSQTSDIFVSKVVLTKGYFSFYILILVGHTDDVM